MQGSWHAEGASPYQAPPTAGHMPWLLTPANQDPANSGCFSTFYYHLSKKKGSEQPSWQESKQAAPHHKTAPMSPDGPGALWRGLWTH